MVEWIKEKEHFLPVNRGLETLGASNMIKLMENPRMNEAGKYCLGKNPKVRKFLFG